MSGLVSHIIGMIYVGVVGVEARPWFRRWCCMTLLCSGHCPGWVTGAGPGWNYAVRSSTAESGQLQQHLANLLIILTLVTRSQVNTDPPSVKPSHSLSLPSPASAHHTPATGCYLYTVIAAARPSVHPPQQSNCHRILQ